HTQPSSNGARVVNAPEVVALELEGGRRLEAGHGAALWVEPAERAADHTVLPGRVDTLEHQQHAALGLGPQPSVQLLELIEQGVALLSRCRLAAESESISGVPPGEPGRVARRDLQVGEIDGHRVA